MPQTVNAKFNQKAVHYVGFSGMTFLSLFGINAILEQLTILSTVIFTLVTFTGLSLWLMHRFNNIKIGQNGITVAVIFMTIYLIYTGGYNGTGALWGFPAILVIVILQGFKKSIFVIAMLLVTVALIFSIHPAKAVVYESAYQIRYLGSMTLISIMVLIYEYQRVRAERQVIEMNEKLHETSLKDALTGLLNRRAAEAELQKQFAKFQRHQTPLSVVMLDIDHFKNINDTLGHSAGDKVLIEVAKTLSEFSRVEDSVARWGGEEFLIILPNSNLYEATQTAEKMLKHLRNMTFSDLNLENPVTASFGVQSLMPTQDLENLLKAVDKKLYRAKELGRNRVVYQEQN